jgi:hypothetical protein
MSVFIPMNEQTPNVKKKIPYIVKNVKLSTIYSIN